MIAMIKEEITGYAILLLANTGYHSLNFERISNVMDISITEVKKHFHDLDDLVFHVLQEASRFCHEVIFPIVNQYTYPKALDARQEIFNKFNNFMIRFFYHIPLGISFIKINSVLKTDDRFSRMLEAIKLDWINALKRALLLIDNEYDAFVYFSNVLKNATNKVIEPLKTVQLH